VGVEAGDQFQFSAACATEGLTAANTDFLECFQAVRDEGGANHQQSSDAEFGEALQLPIRVRLHPRVSPEAALEGY